MNMSKIRMIWTIIGELFPLCVVAGVIFLIIEYAPFLILVFLAYLIHRLRKSNYNEDI